MAVFDRIRKWFASLTEDSPAIKHIRFLRQELKVEVDRGRQAEILVELGRLFQEYLSNYLLATQCYIEAKEIDPQTEGLSEFESSLANALGVTPDNIIKKIMIRGRFQTHWEFERRASAGKIHVSMKAEDLWD